MESTHLVEWSSGGGCHALGGGGREDERQIGECRPLRSGTQFTCFTNTKVQILTPEELRARLDASIKAGDAGAAAAIASALTADKINAQLQALSLLALLVHKYRY